MGCQAAFRRRDRRLPQGVRTIRLHPGADTAPRLVPDQPRTSRRGAARKIARSVPRRDAALRTAGPRPPEFPPRQPPAADHRAGEPRPDRRVDQYRARQDKRRDGRDREYRGAGFEPRIPLRAPGLPDRPGGGQIARGGLHRHLPRLRGRV